VINKTLLIISNGYPFFNKKDFYSYSFVKVQVNELKKHFKKVVVICPTPYFPKTIAKHSSISYTFKENALRKNYKYDNVEVYFPKYFTLPITYCRKRNGIYAYHTTKKTIKKLKLNFDLIHSHFNYISGYVATELKKDYKIPVVTTIHRNRISFLKEYHSNNKNYVSAWKNADLLIRINKQDIKLLKHHNKNTKFIPNCINSCDFNIIDKNYTSILPIPKHKKVLLNVANLVVSHKNHINLIKAIKELTTIRRDFILYLIGEGIDKQLIIDKIEELHLGDYIKVLGAKPHNEIPIWMNAADLFVFPSYTESFGVVNIEALACGVPVVSTINGGSEEIIINDSYGFLLKNPEDYKGLSVLINKALNKQWNTNKILDYSKTFSSEIVCNQILNEYNILLGGKNEL